MLVFGGVICLDRLWHVRSFKFQFVTLYDFPARFQHGFKFVFCQWKDEEAHASWWFLMLPKFRNIHPNHIINVYVILRNAFNEILLSRWIICFEKRWMADGRLRLRDVREKHYLRFSGNRRWGACVCVWKCCQDFLNFKIFWFLDHWICATRNKTYPQIPESTNPVAVGLVVSTCGMCGFLDGIPKVFLCGKQNATLVFSVPLSQNLQFWDVYLPRDSGQYKW